MNADEWVLVGDLVWLTIFVQCPNCNSGVNVFIPTFAESDEIEAENILLRHQPHLCSCGYILVHEEISNRIQQRYVIPSCVWVCPNCSHYQSKCLTMTDVKYEINDGEEWQTDPEKKYRCIETFEGEDFLQCKNCKFKYKLMSIYPNEDSILQGLWERKERLQNVDRN